ncbi:MAG: YtxH domain-containing protein [Ferruginibacter sp.]
MTTVKKLLVGVAVGAILGILYAPDKGSVTRRKLSRKGNNLREKFNDLRDAINDKIDSLKEDVDEMADQELEILENKAAARQNSWQS